MSVETLGLSEAGLQYVHLVWLVLVLVTSATALEEELLVILRDMEVGGDVTDRVDVLGLKTDKAMSLRGAVLAEGETVERFGGVANIPQLLDEGVLIVGVGGGAEGRNAVLKAKPIMIVIRANKVTALTDLTCSVIGLKVTFLVSRPISWKTP